MTPAKCSVWVRNLNYQKHVKNVSTATLELFNARTGSKEKQTIFEKWRVFGIWQNCPLRKGHGPCKMDSVSQKLELLKAWDNFSKFSKIGHYARAIAFAKSSIWVKHWNCWRHMKNLSKTTLRLFHAKKRLQKHLITSFPISTKLATMQRL